MINGQIMAGPWVRLAATRHLTDLAEAHACGFWFDREAVADVGTFFAALRHSKGEWAGRPFALEGWQWFILGSLMGWKRADGLRRFRTAYVEVGRKNGKSTISAGLGLYLAFFDGEPGAEVYAAATKRDQAKIVWSEARRMVLRTPSLRRLITTLVANLHQEATASKFEPLGADVDSMDGLNIHAAIVDELHAHKTREMWDVLETATGSRRQPLLFAITTAGHDRESICRQQHDHVERILTGLMADDTMFGYIATLDEGDDPMDPAVWPKSNPNLGVSVKPDDLARLAERAKSMPAALNAFLRLRHDVWTQGVTRLIDLTAWDAAPPITRDLGRQRCWAGLDLSSTTDLTALVLVFPDDTAGGYDVLPWFWLPAENLRERILRDRLPYDAWERAGLLETTPGARIDRAYVRRKLQALRETYDIVEVCYDPWNAHDLRVQLEEQDGFTCVEIRQGFLSLSAPTKELEALVATRQLRHGGHPILRVHADAVEVDKDAAGNYKPSKKRPGVHIDGISACITALARAMVRSDPTSIYATEPLFRVPLR